MQQLVRRTRRASLLGLFVVATRLTGAPVAWAAVTEPNGQAVPDLAQATNSSYRETTLQAYFDSVGETIDALAAASAEPGTFSPLCNFQAELVLTESGAKAGIAWYNVDAANPSTPPPDSALHHILQPSNVKGATIDAGDIRADPAYSGGYIGFALTKDSDNSEATPPTAIYYSEARRNALCSGCTPPGNWITSIAYHSTTRSDTYYLAFEDWEGASALPSSWGNDGDFNDKVFKLIGISCAGGGVECDTGELGLCGKGVSECALGGGAPTCTRLYDPRAEVCDSIDNDCNGQVDDGQLCAIGQICLRGSCVFPCGSAEFLCPTSMSCGTDSYCIDSSCVNVKCDAGQACRGGVCTSPCGGIVCPLRQTCVDGVCKDLCAGKVCGPDSVCQDGACIGTCGCTACSSGKTCDVVSGYCVDPGCENLTCPEGQGCVAGQCVDACANAICPGGVACASGSCAPPPAAVGGAGSGSGGFAGSIGVGVGAGGSTGTTPAGAGGALSTGTSTSAAPFTPESAGCGCKVAGLRSTPPALWLSLFGIWLGARRTRKGARLRR